MIQTTRVCARCKVEKPLNMFYKSKKEAFGIAYNCKTCAKDIQKEYSRTKKGFIKGLYRSQISSSKSRKMNKPNYSVTEFEDWIKSQSHFNYLFQNWVNSNYKTELKPSADRLDDYKGYSMDNIQLMTWGENKRKGHDDRMNGINNKQNKIVVKCDLNGKELKEYYSLHQASRENKGIITTKICACCKGRRNSTGGFKWKYKEKK